MRNRILQFLFIVARQAFTSVVRAVITSLVFATGVLIASYYLGVPIPSPYELIDKFDGVARLADVLS